MPVGGRQLDRLDHAHALAVLGAGVHRHRAAERARDAREELGADQRRCCLITVTSRAIAAPAPSVSAARRSCSSTSLGKQVRRELQGDARHAAVADERVRPAAEHRHRHLPSIPASSAASTSARADSGGPDFGRPPTRTLRPRARAARRRAPRPGSRREQRGAKRGVQRPGHAHPLPFSRARSASKASSSGPTWVMSPAPSVMTMSPSLQPRQQRRGEVGALLDEGHVAVAVRARSPRPAPRR